MTVSYGGGNTIISGVSMRNFIVACISLCLLFVPPAYGAKNDEVLISAAASLNAVMQELVREYKALYPGSKILLNFGATGVLEVQIRQGAPASIFVGAAPLNLERLKAEGLVTTDSLRVWCRNRLTL